MITAMDRLAAAREGRVLDRIPVFCNLLEQGARELGLSIREYYSRGAHVAEAQLRMRERYGYDNVWGLFYVAKEAELLGCRDVYFADDGPPNVAAHPIKSLEDIARLQVPEDLASHPAMQEPLECLRILRDEVGGTYPICVYVTASTSLPAMLMGMEGWLRLLCFGPPAERDALLEKCSTLVRRQLELYRRAGADVLLYSSPFGSTTFLPRKMLEAISVPWMKRDLGADLGPRVVYYCGSARLNDVIPLVRDELGIRDYYPGPFDDLAAGTAAIPSDGLCFGVINDIELADWSEEQIYREVEAKLAPGLVGGHVGFGTVLMPLGIPEANIRAMLAAACQVGSAERIEALRSR